MRDPAGDGDGLVDADVLDAEGGGFKLLHELSLGCVDHTIDGMKLIYQVGSGVLQTYCLTCGRPGLSFALRRKP